MEPISSIYAPPWADPSPFRLLPSRSRTPLRSSADISDPTYAKATWYSDGSLLAGAAGGAAVRVANSRVCNRILVPLGEGQVAEGEVEGIVQATERALRSNADQTLIVTDSQRRFSPRLPALANTVPSDSTCWSALRRRVSPYSVSLSSGPPHTSAPSAMSLRTTRPRQLRASLCPSRFPSLSPRANVLLTALSWNDGPSSGATPLRAGVSATLMIRRRLSSSVLHISPQHLGRTYRSYPNSGPTSPPLMPIASDVV
jgi:hypothetical protein